LCISGLTEFPKRSAYFVTWWFSCLVTKLEDFIENDEFLGE
jgi:hypothetical protein